MAKVERFEDLVAWQKARLVRKQIYRVTRLPAFRQDLDYRRQIQRAAVSVMSNIAEGFERGGRAEFAQFLSTAKASCGEVRSLFVALDEGWLDEPQFRTLMDQVEEAGRVIGGLRAAVATQRDNARVRPGQLSPQS